MSEASWAPAGRPWTQTSAASWGPSLPGDPHLLTAQPHPRTSGKNRPRRITPSKAWLPPRTRPLRVFWRLNVLHVACPQLSEEGEVVLGGVVAGRPPTLLRRTLWGSLTPLSRSMSRKWVARSSSGRRIWGGGVLAPPSCLSASWGLGLTWPSVLQGTRYRESTRALETHLILTATFQSPPGPWKEQSL